MSKNPRRMPATSAELYDVAEVILDDADNLYRNWLDGCRQQLVLFENYLDSARATTDAVAKKAIALTAKNLAAAFQYAHKLMRAKDASEIVHLQLEFYQKQCGGLAAQLQDLGETAIRTAELAS
jgi:hypothetical protein